LQTASVPITSPPGRSWTRDSETARLAPAWGFLVGPARRTYYA
jgi:hypothetical protein